MRSTLFIVFLIICRIAYPQTPQAFKYQAVVRDNAGNIVPNKIIGIRTSILIDSISGNSVYTESHSIATNDFGVINLSIGKGTVISGNFSNINWGGHNYFVKNEADFNGGTNYQLLGVSQLLSVPFALYAEKSGSSGIDNDKQTLNLNGRNLSISNGNNVFMPSDLDSLPTNELQTLSLNGTQLSISNGNTIQLGGTVDLDSDPTNELQLLSKNGDTLLLSNGNFVVLDKDNDLDSLNELQLLNKSNDTLYLSKGNFVVFNNDNDRDSLNEIQYLNISGDTLFLTKSNYVLLPKDLDTDPTNELQTLTITQDSIKLSGGGSFAFPQPTNAVLPSGGCFYSENPNPPQGYSYSGEKSFIGKFEWETIWDTVLNYSSTDDYSTILNGKIYTIYGSGANKIFYEIDLDTKKSRLLNNNFRLRGGAVQFTEHLIALNEKIYFIGGPSSAYFNWVDIYDIATDTWSIGNNSPVGICSGASTTYNNKIYFIGSSLNSTSSAYNKVVEWDVASDTWNTNSNASPSVFADVSYDDVLILNDTLFFGVSSSLFCFPLNQSGSINFLYSLPASLSSKNRRISNISNNLYYINTASSLLNIYIDKNRTKVNLIYSMPLNLSSSPNYIESLQGNIIAGEIISLDGHFSFNIENNELKNIPSRNLNRTSNSIIKCFNYKNNLYLSSYSDPFILKLKVPTVKYMHCAN